jgi:hypothetical protein
MPWIFAPSPARQNIAPHPADISSLAARSDISATLAAPLQAYTSTVLALPPQHDALDACALLLPQQSAMFVSFPVRGSCETVRAYPQTAPKIIPATVDITMTRET